MFSTALPPSICAAAARAIDIIETEPDRRTRLLQRAADLRTQLLAAGIPTPSGLTGPILPVLLQSSERAVEVARQLELAGFLVGAIRPPTVPPGTSRLRITLCSGHSEDDVRHLAEALTSILQN
jgi:8-amino-7-oxononanoate synthase